MVWAKVTQAAGTAPPNDNLFEKSGIHIPDGGAQTANGGTNIGQVVVAYIDPDANVVGDESFTINGNAFPSGVVYTAPGLTAKK